QLRLLELPRVMREPSRRAKWALRLDCGRSLLPAMRRALTRARNEPLLAPARSLTQFVHPLSRRRRHHRWAPAQILPLMGAHSACNNQADSTMLARTSDGDRSDNIVPNGSSVWDKR